MSQENFPGDLFEDFDEYETEQTLQAQHETRAALDPHFDYFDQLRRYPKQEIGAYVASCGIPVPLIHTQAEWEQACDDGTAMLRSEMRQDYDGLSGLLKSEVLSHRFGYEETDPFRREFNALIMRGLKSGAITGQEYMMMDPVGWAWQIEDAYTQAQSFGVKLKTAFFNASTSRWRYIAGTNVTVFRDPHVDGRYYFGVTPAGQSIGEFTTEADEHEAPQTYRKHEQPFLPKPFIDLYEKVRALPRFDQSEIPVMEMQQAHDGTLYFLQYLKTGQKLQLIDPFDLPQTPDAYYVDNVRGITEMEGEDIRLYCTPTRLHTAMVGQGIYCSLTRPSREEVQHSARAARFVLDYAYVSLKDNHSSSSPFFKPAVAAGLWTSLTNNDTVIKRVNNFTKGIATDNRSTDQTVSYIDLHLTSNGRLAAIESDWQPTTVNYRDL